jgi:Leucine-rich repeat (LRR) protein
VYIGQVLSLSLKASDIDNDNLTYTLLDPDSFAANEIVTTVSADSVGVAFTPAKIGERVLRVQVTDGALPAIAKIIITVRDNDTTKPSISLLSHTDKQVVTVTPITVRVGASDDNGIAWVKINGVAASRDDDGNFSTSVALILGDNPIQVIAQDSSGNANCDTLVKTVVYNPAPVAGAVDTVKLNEDVSTPKSINLSGTDSPGSSLKWYIVDKPLKGTLSADSGNISVAAELTFTPKPDSNGIDMFTYMVSDGVSASQPETVYIAISPVNDKPVISGQKPLNMTEDSTLQLKLSDLTVTDVDNSSANLTLAVHAREGYTVAGTSVTPALNFNGTLSVAVTVSDGTASSDTFEVQITVTPVNDLPVVKILSPVNGDSLPFDAAFDVQISWSDPEGVDSVEVMFDTSVVSHAKSSPFTQAWKLPFGPLVVGGHSIKVRVKDAQGVWIEDSVGVEVSGTRSSDSLSILAVIDTNNMPKGVNDLVVFVDDRIRRFEFADKYFTMPISRIPAEFSNLSACTTISISETRLDRGFASEVGRMKNLKGIHIGNSSLNSFPSSFGNLVSLKTITVYSPEFGNFPEEITNCTNLERIFVALGGMYPPPRSGKITKLPDNIGALKKLKGLSIINNQISSLPIGVVELKVLDTLVFYGNKLTDLPGRIVELTELKFLDVRQNHLTNISVVSNVYAWLDAKNPGWKETQTEP